MTRSFSATLIGKREKKGDPTTTMDCCICSPFVSMYRPPRNAICGSCYEGAKGMITFLNEHVDGNAPKLDGLKPNSAKGISDALKQLKEMKDREEEKNERLGFLESFVVTLEEGIQTDILVRPGNGPPILAHRAVLAARSEILKNVLSSDECKAPAGDAISLPELSHDELSFLLEFLYRGELPKGCNGTQLHSLLTAADKYDIPFLKKQCEQRILMSLEPSNALQVLELSHLCSDMLKEQAMEMIVEHVDEVVFSVKYYDFALKNAHLCVEITRALLVKMRDKTATDVIIHRVDNSFS